MLASGRRVAVETNQPHLRLCTPYPVPYAFFANGPPTCVPFRLLIHPCDFAFLRMQATGRDLSWQSLHHRHARIQIYGEVVKRIGFTKPQQMMQDIPSPVKPKPDNNGLENTAPATRAGQNQPRGKRVAPIGLGSVCDPYLSIVGKRFRRVAVLVKTPQEFIPVQNLCVLWDLLKSLNTPPPYPLALYFPRPNGHGVAAQRRAILLNPGELRIPPRRGYNRRPSSA